MSREDYVAVVLFLKQAKDTYESMIEDENESGKAEWGGFGQKGVEVIEDLLGSAENQLIAREAQQ